MPWGGSFPPHGFFYALSLLTIRTIGRIISNKSFYKTKNEILSTILPLASKEGLRNLSLSQIAKNAGIAKSTLYSHFSSKDEMIDQLYLFIRKQAKERRNIGVVDYGKYASEYRVGSTFLEIIYKTSVQIAQGLLQGNGIHHFQKGKVITSFHYCQHRRSLGVAGLAAIF